MSSNLKAEFEIAEPDGNVEVRESTFGFRISFLKYFIILQFGFVIILTLGLISGLVLRPKNCIERIEITTISTACPVTTVSTANPTVPATTTPVTGETYSVVLAKIASLKASISSREIFGSAINVSQIEDAARSYYATKFKPIKYEQIWQAYSPYFFSVKFTFKSSETYFLDDLIEDFMNDGYNKIFSSDKLPSGYLAYKSDFNAALLESTCDICAQKPTQPTDQKTTTKPDISLSDKVRLPSYFIPVRYDLRLNAFFQPETTQPDDSVATNYYTGKVAILFDLKNNTKSIVFHADSMLKLNTIKVYRESYHIPEEISLAADYLERLDYQLVRVNLAYEVNPGSYKLEIDFSSDYGPSSNLVGFYRTKYVENGTTYSVLGSKFQPTYARNAYPCFDEPALKAEFTITIEHPQKSIALSNWPEKSTEQMGNRIVTSFESTSKMSTYLAAWAVLPENFKYKEIASSKGKPIRVYARRQVVDSGLIDFALEVAKKSTDYFQDVYFRDELQALPPKIDMIGFPDFPSGAMEHWGIIGYRENNLFYLDNKNPLSSKQSVAFVIAHEISHFWFGNLVTCKWWNDLWLNEAMARFLQFKAVDYIFPEWNVNDQFVTLYQLQVMFDDGFPSSSHPVSAEVLTPSEINTLFDSITYDKGSSLLRMLESTVTEENFRLGLNNYLTDNEFGASDAASFYSSLRLPSIMQVQNVTPQQYMENWLLQINYPQISVRTSKNNGKTTVTFKQSRFNLNTNFPDPTIGISSPYGYKWLIYLRCKAGNSIGTDVFSFEAFLNMNDSIVELNKNYDWVKCNTDFKGFYVNEYTNDSIKLMMNALKLNPNIFSTGDLANLVHNTFTQAYLPYNRYDMVAEVVSYLKSSVVEYVPWRCFTWHMGKLASLLEHRASFVELRKFGTKLVYSLENKIDIWNEDGAHQVKMLKATLFEFLCRMQDEQCLKNATERFNNLDSNYFNNPNTVNNNISPNIRGSVYKYHIQNTNDYQEWYKLASVYGLTVDPQERALIMDAIANSRISWIIDSICLECTWTGATAKVSIRPQDFFTILTYIGRNPNGRHYAWYFVRHYWEQLVKSFGLTNRPFANALKSICETFENEFLQREMELFFSRTEAGTGSLQRSQAVDIVSSNVIWIQLDKETDLTFNLLSISN